MKKEIIAMIEESTKTQLTVKEKLSNEIESCVNLISDCLKNGNKVLIAGNGGSASQASHIAAEFVGRYKIERKGLSCIALTSDLSIITAWSNDYSYDTVFSRQIEAHGNEGDVFIALTTSGNSKNLIEALNECKKRGVKSISLLGKDGGKMKGMADIELIVSSNNTPRIQESHIMILHIICELIDNKLFRG